LGGGGVSDDEGGGGGSGKSPTARVLSFNAILNV